MSEPQGGILFIRRQTQQTHENTFEATLLYPLMATPAQSPFEPPPPKAPLHCIVVHCTECNEDLYAVSRANGKVFDAPDIERPHRQAAHHIRLVSR